MWQVPMTGGSVTEWECMNVSISEYRGAVPKTFCINIDCISRTYTCVHMVAGSVCQLRY